MNFENLLLTAIEKQLAEDREKAVMNAVQDFEKKLRRTIGQVVLNLHEMYSVQRLGNELVIHVKIER